MKKLNLSFVSPLSIQARLATFPVCAEGRPLSRWKSNGQAGQPGCAARRRWSLVRNRTLREYLILQPRAVHRCKVRRAHPEDRRELQGVYVSIVD